MAQHSVRREIEEHGYAVVSSGDPDLSTHTAFSRVGLVGRPVGLNRETDFLRPSQIRESRQNTYSGHFGTGEFPLHTDLAHWFVPPRYVGLRAIIGNEQVTTHLFDGRNLITEFGLMRLRRVLVQPRRPVAGKRPLMRILEIVDGNELIRWDSLFLVAATAQSAGELSTVTTHLNKSRQSGISLCQPDQLLIIDNWRILHGRSAVPDGVERLVERVYLEAIS